MRKQFIIPRQDIKIPTRRKSSEEKEVTNSFSNHPTGRTKWSRDILVGKKNPLFNENNGRR